MIVGIGTDLMQISRMNKIISKFGEAFEQKVFTPFEIERAKQLSPSKKSAFYAKRFAAKEAFSKALGTGIGTNAFFKDIEIQNDAKGAPFYVISGKAKETLEAKTNGQNYQIHLSLSDEKAYATAFVVIETY